MIQDFDHDSVTAHLDASADAIYDVVSDITRTPEYSPEIVKAKWIKGSTEPVAGARFRAFNKVPNRPAWFNSPVVLVADRGREFTFARTEVGGGTVEWSYKLDAQSDGTTIVTESYKVTKKINAFGWFIISVLMNAQDRRGVLRAGMQQSLHRIGELAKADAAKLTA